MLAGIEIARGDHAAAAVFAAEANRLEGEMPAAFGPPFVDWPAAEMLGEILLASDRFADAAAAFELSLTRTRQRTRSLLGLAQAQAQLGNHAAANFTMQKLAGIWRNADPSVKAILGDHVIKDADGGTGQ